LFEGHPHPMWVFDLESLGFLDVNEAAVRHYGYSRGEFLRMTIKDIRPAEDLPRLLEHMLAVHESPSPGTLAWRHRKRDGSVLDVEITSLR
jgi:PAS domain S-box-containing protein